MADIFVSYTSSDKDWAYWIGLEIEKLGHVAHLHEWEISAGGNIPAWMEKRHHEADHVLFVVSKLYLTKDYSNWERLSAEWAAVSGKPNFGLPVFVEQCETPTLLAPFKRCDLYGLNENEARARLAGYLAPATKPTFARFPGARTPIAPEHPKTTHVFPGAKFALSNIPLTVPRFFLGREDALKKIEAALKDDEGRTPITALHGLRGVGKSTLAAAYAERHRSDYRATWWIRAQTESTIRADLAALGVRLGWVAAEEREDAALEKVMERLRHEGEGLLLIFDNATDARRVEPYLPSGGLARLLVTSNAPDWGAIAEPVEIEIWPEETGAEYLIARTGRKNERAEAEALSDALGGLPLAHEQAAAYCGRVGLSLGDYRKRFEAAPAKVLGIETDAPLKYRMTAVKAFALAIDEAAKQHPAAEPLIFHAALLAPEPIPLYLFSEGRQKFRDPLATLIADDGLDEAVAALRAFALVDRETIVDEREPAVTTDTIRLHRLVRIAATARQQADEAEVGRGVLIEAMVAVYPNEAHNIPSAWPRARRLDALAVDLVAGPSPPPKGKEASAGHLLNMLALYKLGPLADLRSARALSDRSVAILEKALGPDHPLTAASLTTLGNLLFFQGDIAAARPLMERALAVREKMLGPDHPETAESLNYLSGILFAQGDIAAARPVIERALANTERALGPRHPQTVNSIANAAALRVHEGDFAAARPLYERVVRIAETEVGPDHPFTANSLDGLGTLLFQDGDLAGARPLLERALAIRERALGPEHPATVLSLDRISFLLGRQGDLGGAKRLLERALAIREKALGPDNLGTATTIENLGQLLVRQGDFDAARPLYERVLAIHEKSLGREHASTVAVRLALERLRDAEERGVKQ